MFLSETFAVASALCVALSSMFLAELRGRVAFLQLLRWQLLAAFAINAAISLALGGWRTLGISEFWLLVGSGVVGMAIGNTTYLATVFSVGPRMTALLFSLSAPFSVALGYLVLGETINGYQGIGIVLVMSAVAFAIGISGLPISSKWSSAGMPAAAPGAMSHAPLGMKTWLGICLGVATALLQAVGTLLARPAMAAGVEPFTAMAVRCGLAAAIFTALAYTPSGATAHGPLRLKAFGMAMAATCLGTVLGMVLFMAALHRGDVGVVSTLGSLTPVLILPMVWIRSGVPPTAGAWFGALLAIAGIGMISVR